jgi:hypothetical protein
MAVTRGFGTRTERSGGGSVDAVRRGSSNGEGASGRWHVRVRRHRWAEHLVALAIFIAVATVFLWPAITRQEVYTTAANTQSIRFPWAAAGEPFTQVVQSDEAELSHPWQTLLTRTLRDDRELAFWNPHSFAGGTPLYANGSSGQLAPPRLLTAFTVSPTTAHEWSSWLHLVGAGFGVYLLLRQLGSRWWGGLGAGLAWQCSGFVLAWLHLEVVTPTFVYLPVCVALVHRAVTRRSDASTLGLGIAAALLLVSGHLMFALLSLLVVFGYGSALALRRHGPSARPRTEAAVRLGRVALAGIVAVGLAAVVLLPTAVELSDSQRARVTVEELRMSGTAEPTEVLLRVGWPDSLPLDADEIQFQPFVGLFGAVLALVGFLGRRREGAGLARTLVIVGLAATAAGPVMWVLRFLPVFNAFRPYGRFSLWAAFGLVILIGHGTDQAHHWLRRAWARRIRGHSRAVVVVVAAVLAVNTLHQVTWGRGANPTFWPRTAESTFPSRPVLDEARSARTSAGWPVMVVPVDRFEPGESFVPSTLGAELHTVFGIDAATGYDSTVPVRTSQLLRVMQGEDVEAVLTAPQRPGAERPRYASSVMRWDLLDRIGVGMTLLPPLLVPEDPSWGSPNRASSLGPTRYAGPDGYLVEVQGWGSGPQLVPDTEVVAGSDDALRRFVEPAFPYRETAVVTSAVADGLVTIPRGGGAGTVIEAERSTNDVRVVVETDAPMWLVLPINWHRGWSATLDGDPVEIHRANFQRVAIVLPGGRHDVTLRFRPPALGFGTAITISMALVTGLGFVVIWRRRPRLVGPPGAGVPRSDAASVALARAKFENELIREHRRPRLHQQGIDLPGDPPGDAAAAPEADGVER